MPHFVKENIGDFAKKNFNPSSDWVVPKFQFNKRKKYLFKKDGLISELEILLACNAAPPVRRLARADITSNNAPPQLCTQSAMFSQNIHQMGNVNGFQPLGKHLPHPKYTA